MGSWRHPVLVALAAAGVVGATALGCGNVLGLDDGQPLEDASGDATSRPDASSGDDGGEDATDAEFADCAADPTYCYTHCGQGVDMCGHAWSCTFNCPTQAGWFCSPSQNTCACSNADFTCGSLCGIATDPCGVTHNCGSCDSGGCMQSNTCAPGQECGFAVSCGLQIPCGTTAGNCPSGGTCQVEAGTCCTPATDPCGTQCGVTVSAGCDIMVDCPACPEAGPPDSGGPDDSGLDGGACATSCTACGKGCCCDGSVCRGNGKCM